MSRSAACIAVLCLVLCSLPAMAGPVTLLSKADPARPSGTAGGSSEIAGISSDGRYVAFLSNADNLLPGVTDTNGGKDVFLHDRIAGTTVLVSHAAGDLSTAGDGAAVNAALSDDGRWVAFGSFAADLAAGQVDDGDTADLFLWDRTTGVSVLVSHRPGLPTTAAGGVTGGPLDLSAGGGRIVFLSSAPDLVAGQSDDSFSIDAFLYDRAAGINTLVSHTSGSATAAAGGVSEAFVSADGNWVTFVSQSPSLVAGQVDPSGMDDVFLYDRAAGTNVLVSHAAGQPATAADQFSAIPQISADGGWIAYQSFATNLVAGQVEGNEAYDVFLYERATGASVVVSHALSSATTTGNFDSEAPSLSSDGRYVAYMGQSTNLVAESTGNWQSTFVYDRLAGTNVLVHGALGPGGDSILPRISSDGTWVAFLGTDEHLVPGQTDTFFTWDVFLWSRVSGTVLLVTRLPGSAATEAGDSFSADLQISADGSWLAYSSSSPRLADGVDGNTADDVFLYGRAAGVSTLLSSRGGVAPASAGGTIASQAGRTMSNDGRFIAFTSAAPNLPGVTDDGNSGTDVFLFNRDTSVITLVSHASGSPMMAADAVSGAPEVSADGTFVAFASAASNLVAGQPPPPIPYDQLYRWDRSSGAVSLISHEAGSSAPADGTLADYALSGDGRWIAFSHTGTNLVAGQIAGSGAFNVFLFDRTTGTSTLVSHSISSPLEGGDANSFSPAVSTDGRYVAFASYASNLVTGQTGIGGIFLIDRMTGAIVQVSSSLEGPLAISGDGRWVVFQSSFDDVVAGQVDANGGADVFLWDRVSGSALLVSRAPASPTTTGNGLSSLSFPGEGLNPANVPVLSADGRWVAFASDATDLVNGQTGDPGGVYLFDRITGTVTLVSRLTAGPTANGNGRSTEPAISADGRFVAYLSEAGDLVPGQVDPGAGADVFLYDRISGTTALVSHIPSSAVTGGKLGSVVEEAPRLSADGAWVAFSSASPDLVAGDHDGVTDAFLYANPLGRDLFTLSPCRILDTRLAGQGPALLSGAKRTWVAPGLCGIPATARAIAVNVTITQPSGVGYLIFHAGDIAPETTSTINFIPGQTRSNNAILPLAFDGTGTFAVTPFVAGLGAVHLIVDVSGWFE